MAGHGRKSPRPEGVHAGHELAGDGGGEEGGGHRLVPPDIDTNTEGSRRLWVKHLKQNSRYLTDPVYPGLFYRYVREGFLKTRRGRPR